MNSPLEFLVRLEAPHSFIEILNSSNFSNSMYPNKQTPEEDFCNDFREFFE